MINIKYDIVRCISDIIKVYFSLILVYLDKYYTLRKIHSGRPFRFLKIKTKRNFKNLGRPFLNLGSFCVVLYLYKLLGESVILK